LQAYGVLDKYKISKTFFVKTDQADCAYLDAPLDLEESTEKEETEKPVAEKKPVTEKRKRKPQPIEPNENYRSTIALNDADTEIKEEGAIGIIGEKPLSDIPKIIAEEPAKLEQPIETVPERILKLAEAIKEESGDTNLGDKMIIVEVKEENVTENSKEEKSEHSKETEATA